MRYITDDNGRLRHISFGADIECDFHICQEYTGAVPWGYASLEAWYLAEADQLYKWTIVDRELTLDENAPAPAPDSTVTPVEEGGTGATTAEDARRNLGVAAAAWEPIGSWGYGGSLSADFTQYNELKFVIDMAGDNYNQQGGGTIDIPTGILTSTRFYFPFVFSSSTRYVLDITQARAQTYSAVIGDNSSAYRVYCFGR